MAIFNFILNEIILNKIIILKNNSVITIYYKIKNSYNIFFRDREISPVFKA